MVGRVCFDLIEEDKSWRVEKNINQLAEKLLNWDDYLQHIPTIPILFDITTYKGSLNTAKKKTLF